jgi:hypothetical protein
MELLNATPMQAGYTLGLDPDGLEHLVVVVKGTFAIPEDGSMPELTEEQVPLVMADEYYGEPGLSAVRYESDFAPFKPKCDVLLHGSAYAPEGMPVERLAVGLSLGTFVKQFDVVGERFWVYASRPSDPMPFDVMPIGYDRAFGGVDVDKQDPERVMAFGPNPIGVGFLPCTKKEDLKGKRLPNTEERGIPITSREGPYRPMSFGPVGRNFSSRYVMAGTYDQNWLDNVFPFLPGDFNPLYYQAAPADQQVAYPRGGESVHLVNLTRAGRTNFKLPSMEVPVEFTSRTLERTTHKAVLDTVLIEPDLGRFMLTWRASTPLKKNMLEMAQVIVGRMPRGWYRARETGKTYYPSLADLVRFRRADAVEEDLSGDGQDEDA